LRLIATRLATPDVASDATVEPPDETGEY